MKKNWWKESVVYQIYPRSFKDSNGDGIGDIPGIIEKLDYLKELGVNVLWISPMLESPQDDNGYDISDYRKIYKEYGDHLYTIIQENPYKMTDDIAGVGFKIADEIAKKVGIGSNSDYRIISGIFYTLMRALNEGHVFLPKYILCRNAARQRISKNIYWK